MQIAKGFQPSITSDRNANDFIINDYLILDSFYPMLENSHIRKSASTCYKTAESHGAACRAMRELVDGPHSAWVETANGLLRPSMQPPGHGPGADWQAAVGGAARRSHCLQLTTSKASHQFCQSCACICMQESGCAYSCCMVSQQVRWPCAYLQQPVPSCHSASTKIQQHSQHSTAQVWP